MKVVIAGGTGSLGRRIAARLASRGDEIVVLTRSPSAALPWRQLTWDGRTVGTGRASWPGQWWSTWPVPLSTGGRRRPTSSC